MKYLLATLFVLAACAGPPELPPPPPDPPPPLDCPECPPPPEPCAEAPKPAALGPNTCVSFPNLGWLCLQEAGEPYDG